MSFVRQHPVTSYFGVTFAGTWLIQLPMVLGQDGLGLLSYRVPLPLYITLFLISAFVPTAVACWLTYRIDGKQGVGQYLSRFIQWRVGPIPYLIVLFAYPVVYLTAFSLTSGTLPLDSIRSNWSAFITTYLPAILVFPAIINWGEEPGWRGFALTRLQRDMNPLVATVIVGTLHGVWHLSVFLMVSGPPAMGPFELSHFLQNTLIIVLISISWTWVFNTARGSILIASLLHAAGNASGGLMGKWLGVLPERMGRTMLLLYASIALVLVVTTRGQLGLRRGQRMTDQARDTPPEPARSPA